MDTLVQYLLVCMRVPSLCVTLDKNTSQMTKYKSNGSLQIFNSHSTDDLVSRPSVSAKSVLKLIIKADSCTSST